MAALKSISIRAGGPVLAAALLVMADAARAQTPPPPALPPAPAPGGTCTPTLSVSAQPDENGVYTTTLTCADTSAAAGEVDYQAFYYNQASASTPPANNLYNNNVVLRVGSGLVFSAEGYVDFRDPEVDISSVLYVINGGAKTIEVEKGAVLHLRRTPEYWCQSESFCTPERQAARPAATPSFDPNQYRSYQDALNNLAGIWIWSHRNATVRFDGTMELDVNVGGTFADWHSNGNAIHVTAGDTDDTAGARAQFDAVVKLGSSAVIRQAKGSDGVNGIYVEQRTEDGDIDIDLAAGSLIDVSTSGGRGLNAWILPRAGYTQSPQTGDIFIDAAGTIRAAVRHGLTLNSLQGVGISAFHSRDGRVRITSSGTVETWQANAILVKARGGAHRDDPATAEIEGHLIDVTGGKVHTRGGTAIYAQISNADAASAVRVAAGATVRAERDAGPDAVTQEQLGVDGRRYILLNNVYGWRRVDTDGDGENDALEPIVNAIAVGRIAAAAEGVIDRVIVHGAVEAVGGKKDEDAAIAMIDGGEVFVGATGRVSADSGLAISSGELPPDEPPDGWEEPESDLNVTVAGRVDGDVRVLDAGALTLSVPEGGVVTGTVHDPAGPLMVVGSIGRLLYSGGATVTVAATGALTGVEVEVEVDGKTRTRTEALRSAGGDLSMIVAGMVTGDVLGLGDGDHTVTVHKGGTVTGDVRLAASTVRVDGSVGCVRLDRGGVVTVGAGGRIACAEGAGVRSDAGSLAVTVAGTVNGIAAGGALDTTVTDTGKAGDIAHAGDLELTIRAAEGEHPHQAAARAAGRISGTGARTVRIVAADGEVLGVGASGTPQVVPSGPFDVGVREDPDGGVRVASVYAPRARVYEALPSALLGLDVPPAHRDRLAGRRGSHGTWVRAEAGGGERRARSSTSTSGPGIAYDHRSWGVSAGVDFRLGPAALAGVSAHHRRGTANLSDADGRIEAAGTGFGLSGAWTFGDGIYVDGQVQATWYDANLSSGRRGALKSGAKGTGWAAGLEAGRRVDLGPGLLGEVTLTPRLRLVRQNVKVGAFTDSVGSAVSVDGVRSLAGRAGLELESAGEGSSRLFGSVELEREFQPDRQAEVSGEKLSSREAGLRVLAELGVVQSWNEGRWALESVVRYATAAGRGSARDYGGRLSLAVRF